MASGQQLTLFQCVDSENPGRKRVKLTLEDDQSNSDCDGDSSPVSLPETEDELLLD